jgi:20S proteasome subunit beta 4
MAGVQFLLGVKFDDFVIIAADRMLFAHGALTLTDQHNKSFSLGDHVIMNCIGEPGDCLQFGEYIEKNLALYKFKNGYEISPQSAAHYCRRTIATSLRSKHYYVVDLILGGFDTISSTPYLSAIDYLGNKVDSAEYVFRGFGGKFCYSILDELHKPNMNQEQALELIKKCLVEVKRRFVGNLPAFSVHVINKDGVAVLKDIAV